MLMFLCFPVTCNPCRAVKIPNMRVPHYIGVFHRFTYQQHACQAANLCQDHAVWIHSCAIRICSPHTIVGRNKREVTLPFTLHDFPPASSLWSLEPWAIRICSIGLAKLWGKTRIDDAMCRRRCGRASLCRSAKGPTSTSSSIPTAPPSPIRGSWRY